jgi:hypothetical protein
MSINLSAIFSHPSAITNAISYARIDNTTTPVFVQAGNFANSPAVFASNIPAGQYQVNIIPVYADGRICDPTIFQTPACPGLLSITGYIQSGNLVVQYAAPSTVPKVRITVTFPNGGSNVQNYVNTGASIVVPLPAGLFGDYTIQGQSVCDEISAFFSSFSSTVIVSLNQPVAGTFALSIAPSGICGATPGTFYTNGPFAPGVTLYSDSALSSPVTGYNYVVTNNTVYLIDGTTGLIGAATGNTCNANISGATGFSVGSPTSSGLITAPPGTIVHVVLSAGGPSGGTYTLNFNIPSIPVTFNVTNGTNTNTFTMPPSGSVAWNGNYTSSNSTGSGSISVY